MRAMLQQVKAIVYSMAKVSARGNVFEAVRA